MLRSLAGPAQAQHAGCRTLTIGGDVPATVALFHATPVADRRIRAVFALAPMAVVPTPESLAAIRMPVRVLVAEKGVVLNTRYHGAYVVARLPNARAGTVASAGHFAFMAQSTIPLPSAAGDAAANPPGFDRRASLAELNQQVAAFFAEQWR